MLGDDEEIRNRRGDEHHEKPGGQRAGEAPGLGPLRSEQQREEPRRKCVDEREGEDPDEHRTSDGDPDQRAHLPGLDRGELLEEHPGHSAVDENERGIEHPPRHLELSQGGDRVARDEQGDAVGPQRIAQGVRSVEQRHAPVAAGRPAQGGRVLGESAPQDSGLASQVGEGEELARRVPEHQPGHPSQARHAEDELAPGQTDLLLGLVDRDRAVVAVAVEPVLEQLHAGHEEGGQPHQGHPQGHLVPPLPGDDAVEREGGRRG